MKDPYEVLGIAPSASDDEVKAAYRALARKYHPDNYDGNPLSDLAEEKMQEINEAYDAIIRQRRQGAPAGSGQEKGYTAPSGAAASSQYGDVRNYLAAGRYADAETVLDGVPAGSRNAEWYFLKGQVLYRKGWLEDAYAHYATACRMDPSNTEYRYHFNQMEAQRRGRSAQNGGCSGCDVCSGLLCADCCCEAMGGDLIRCC